MWRGRIDPRKAKGRREQRMSQREKGTSRERSGLLSRRGPSLGWGDHSAWLWRSSHAFLRCRGIPFTPNRKAAGLAFVLAVSFACCKILGLISCIGMFSTVKPYFFFNWGIFKARNWTTVPLLISWSEELVNWQIPLAQEVTVGQTGFLHSLLKVPLPLKDISNLKENHTQTSCSAVPKCKSLHSMVTCKVPCAEAPSTSFTWMYSLYPFNMLLAYHHPHFTYEKSETWKVK